ncbi:MAG: lysophospholipid acyltransferase family protein [Phycisphaerales bacterium]
MSDLFYRAVRFVGTGVFFVSSRPIVIDAQFVPTSGPLIIASTHESPFDVPLLIRHTPRLVDFVSVTEVFRNPMMAWFYGNMNAFPLDRSRADPKTVRTILDRLAAGRAVGMFPEGGIHSGADSLVQTGRIRKGLGRIAELSQAPVVPCVILNSAEYRGFVNWLPLRHVRYGMIYGPPLVPRGDPDELEREFLSEIVRLHAILRERLDSRSIV